MTSLPLRRARSLALLGALALTACQSEPVPETPTPAVAAQRTPWVGHYTGMAPCTHCEGLNIELNLLDATHYTLKTRESGKAGKQAEFNGQYTRVGNTLTLDNGATPRQFQMGENVLVPLDENGNRYAQTQKERYMLRKIPASAEATTQAFPPSELDGYTWKLLESSGASASKNASQRNQTLTFKGASQRFYGFGGCNNFSGYFEVKEARALTLSKITSTRKACPNMSAESSFLALFNHVDRYTLSGDTLVLQEGNTPLAKFKGIALR